MTNAPAVAKQPTSDAPKLVEQPPTTIGGILLRLGPGLIIAGSIVGSGELIATTATGAAAGFWLLWLIIIGCVIKVFVQVELGRYAIVNGKTTMDGLDEAPGPRIRGRGNWLVWYWFLMWMASIAQLGGIVGGVGQALAISTPITAEGRQYDQYRAVETQLTVARSELAIAQDAGDAASAGALAPRVAALEAELAGLAPLAEDASPYDAKIWAALIAVITAVILSMGRYGLIQSFATCMVALFTLITVVNLFLLQSHESWSVDWSDIKQGLSFGLPPTGAGEKTSALATALAAFGIIGVGASELVAYPYWCLEKGYARFTGPRDDSPQWAERAKGWMRVMRWDAWCSMFVYTFATIAFYLLGAAILHPTGLDPEGNEMIRYLGVMYEPVFGGWAQVLFLFGAFAVLYSTFFVANAGHARVFSDALRVLGFAAEGHSAHRRRVRILSGLFPLLCLAIFVFVSDEPKGLVLLSGLMQAIMLPMLAIAGLFFRYRRIDSRLKPTGAWDLFLWVSAGGMTVAGLWAAWAKIQENLL